MRKKTRFLGLFIIWFTFIMLLVLVYFVGRNIVYSVKDKKIGIVSEKSFERKRVIPEESSTMVLYQDNKDGRSARNEICATLKQMKIPYKRQKIEE